MKQKPAAVTAAPETAAALTDADFRFIPREGKAADQVVRPSVSYWGGRLPADSAGQGGDGKPCGHCHHRADGHLRPDV